MQIFFRIFRDHEIWKNTGGGSLGLAGGPFEYFGALNLTSSRRVAPNVGASKVLDDLLCMLFFCLVEVEFGITFPNTNLYFK